MALITMLCLSAMATAPFAAQHFGTVTPWGLVANIIGIPLTGLDYANGHDFKRLAAFSGWIGWWQL